MDEGVGKIVTWVVVGLGGLYGNEEGYTFSPRRWKVWMVRGCFWGLVRGIGIEGVFVLGASFSSSSILG